MIYTDDKHYLTVGITELKEVYENRILLAQDIRDELFTYPSNMVKLAINNEGKLARLYNVDLIQNKLAILTKVDYYDNDDLIPYNIELDCDGELALKQFIEDIYAKVNKNHNRQYLNEYEQNELLLLITKIILTAKVNCDEKMLIVVLTKGDIQKAIESIDALNAFVVFKEK